MEEKAKGPRPSSAVPAQPRGIEQVIKAAVDRGASDLHIKAGDVFRARIDGKLVALTKHRLTPERSEEHTSELQSLAYLVCRLLLEKKKTTDAHTARCDITQILYRYPVSPRSA